MSIKLVTFLLLASIMTVSAASMAQKVTLRLKNASLETAFNELKKQTGYDFVYDEQLIQSKTVTINVSDQSIGETLDQLLHPRQLTYILQDNVVTIKEKAAPPPEKPAAPLPATDIVGRVTNTHGQPLDGASVIIKRTQGGTLTDANGNFTLRGVLATDTIVVSYIGYKRQFIKVGSQTSLKVTLEETENQLDQVTIQAYGETTQRTTTGDIGTVTAKEIEKQPVTNVLTALQGQIPGVVVTNNSGYTSGGISVDIRGRNLIGNFPVDPLYVIDGVPLTILDISSSSSYANPVSTTQASLPNPGGGQSPFFSINPADVESITVLKDADATAIYGSRGANGVILITTKKGKAGKAHFDISAYSGQSQLTNGYQMLNSQQYVEMREEALRNDGLPLNIQTAPDIIGADLNRYTNWENYTFGRTGKDDDIEASLSGGDANNTFRIAGGFNYVVDILTASGANERGNLSFNLTHKSPNQRLTVSLTGSYAVSAVNTIQIPNSLNLPPTAPPVYNADGSLNFAGWDAQGLSNPGSVLLQPYTTSGNFLNSDLVISYELVKGLIARVNLGYNRNTTADTYIQPLSSEDPQYFRNNTALFGYSFFHNLIIEPQLEYNELIGKGKLNVLAGASVQDAATSAAYFHGSGYPNDSYLTSLAGASQVNGSITEGEYKYAAAFARIGYNWEDKYIINLNARRDGSTKFGPGKQFGNFGSVGAAYIFSEEKWVKDHLPFMSLGKLRSSYGTTGSDQIPGYQYLTRWTYGTQPYNGNLPLAPQGHTDSLLHWQVNKKLEVAIDLGFLQDRLLFEASWYRNRCNDQLVPLPLPSLTGFTSVISNLPADVQNSGLETSLNARIINGGNFKWSAKFNIGFNRNKLLAYPNLSQSPYANTYQIGQPLNIVYVLHFTGIDPQTGQYTFEDKNHDGQITYSYDSHANDDAYPVRLDPKFNGGFTSNFSWKNWELSVFFYFAKQIKQSIVSEFSPPGNNSNEPAYVLGRWQKPGDITDIAGFTTNSGTTNQGYFFGISDGVYSDDTFIRLQNLALSYTIPATFLTKYGISGGKIFIKAQNLFYLSDYNGLNPETEVGQIPLPRIITGGFSLTF